MEMHLSIFDDEDQRMEEIDQRCQDYRRLGSFFKPWYWDIATNSELYKHFDIKKLEELSNKVTWIKYDNFIKESKTEITQKNWFANYISYIVLNSYIVSDKIYNDLKNHRKLNNFEFTYKLDKTNDEYINMGMTTYVGVDVQSQLDYLSNKNDLVDLDRLSNISFELLYNYDNEFEMYYS